MVLRKAAALLVFVLCAWSAPAEGPPVAPVQLVREVVYNELHDHQQHGYWRYWIERRVPRETLVEEQVETAGGPIALVTGADGHPLNSAEEEEERARLHHLLVSPQEQARHLRQYGQDEQRIGRIVALLPDAFLFDFDGEENGRYRLRFRPNPAYAAHSIEARVFHAMSGTLWVDARYKRLAELEGHVNENVDFGFGLLGRLYKGGWFRLERVRVSDTDWKTERLEVHMNIRALLVTSFARETSELRGGFTPLPSGITVAQGISLLLHPQAEPAERQQPPEGWEAAAGAFAFK